MKLAEFLKDTTLNLYIVNNLPPFHYSDGTIVEQHLARSLSSAKDLSIGSLELRAAEIDWPSTYHLSAERGNLLRWFDFRCHQRVLEIGCGCGAISRFLGENGVDLYAIEGSKERAHLAALRCRDLPNVKVYNTNIQDITPEPVFDLVIMIGVLEYAGVYIRGKNPWADMLKTVRSFLKPDGMLVVAIENKVGLKYWTGCSEDHGAGLFASVHGYIARDKIQTFSKPELTGLLETAGFSVQKFFYPWPDYKLPTVIMQEPRAGLHLDNWIASEFRDYQNQRQDIINDRLAINTIYKAGLLADMANSFLVFSSQQEFNTSAFPKWALRAYSVKRAKPFWTQTTFYSPDKSIIKDRLYNYSPTKFPVQFNPESSSWYEGKQLEYELIESLAAKDINRWRKCLKVYRDFLIQEFGTNDKDKNGAYILKGEAFDCLPKNIIMTELGARAFDLEWKFAEPIPEYLVLARTLLDFSTRHQNLITRTFHSKNLKTIIEKSLRDIYEWIKTEDIELFIKIEAKFQYYVTHNKSVEIIDLRKDLSIVGNLYENTKSDDDINSLVSIIIPVYNRVELTQQCLTHLAQVTSDTNYEVIIVDNGSRDNTSNFLSMLAGDIQIIRNDKNLGFAKACNQGSRAAKGSYLVFLNNDTIPLKGWLRTSIEELTASPDVAVVGSKLLYPNNTIQHAGIVFNRANSMPYHIYRGFPSDAPIVNRRRELHAVTGACMLVRREMFEAVGGFDEDYRNGFEDVDLCLKVRDRGGCVIYQPRSVLYHLESQTPGRKDHEAENQERFLGRWANRWLVDEDAVSVPDGYVISEVEKNGCRSDQLVALKSAEDKARWERVAEVERQGQSGNMEAVRSLLRQPHLWPADSGVLRWAAQICERAEVPEYAEAFWRRALEFGATPDVLLALSRVNLETGSLDEAERHLQKLITQNPTNGEGWLLQGILALLRQDYVGAKAAFEKSLQYGGNARKANKGLAMVAMARGELETAWDMFTAALSNEIDDSEVVHCLLRVGTALERWQPLETYLLDYLKLNPGDISVRFALAGVQVRLSGWDSARETYETIRLLDPAFAGLNDLAQILEKRGDIKENFDLKKSYETRRDNNILYDLGPLYHKYSFFGVDNDQLPGSYELNQKSKEPIILAYIAYAIAKSKRSISDSVSFTELFCADGFYTMIASQLGCNTSIGIDNDRDNHFKSANLISKKLNINNVKFIKEDITPSSIFNKTDIVANIGGLYHVNSPEGILKLSYRLANKYLIVQSVVSLAVQDEDYFAAPAPGWIWGNRFSRKSFDKMIRNICPKIIDYHFNELEGNDRLEDRGSVYYLIEK